MATKMKSTKVQTLTALQYKSCCLHRQLSDTHDKWDYEQSLQQPLYEQKGVAQLLQIEQVWLKFSEGAVLVNCNMHKVLAFF